jgi:hypothetical protein
MGEIQWAPDAAAGRAECADLVAKRAAIELLKASEATVWADSFSRSSGQIAALAVSALTFAFAVTAAGWRVEETAGPSGFAVLDQSTTELMNEIVGRLTWMDDLEQPLATDHVPPQSEAVPAPPGPGSGRIGRRRRGV